MCVFERQREKGRDRDKMGDRDKEEEDKIMLKALNFTGKKSYSADIFSMAKKKKNTNLTYLFEGLTLTYSHVSLNYMWVISGYDIPQSER